jgi:uncharacterized protein DUF6484
MSERRIASDVIERDADASEREAMSNPRGGWEGEVGGLGWTDGVVVGRLVGFADHGITPLVTCGGPTNESARPARTIVDLHASHLGRDVVLAFERGDRRRPIVIGCVRGPADSDLPTVPGQVTVEADGERLVVSARDQIVLRCGKASLTLSADGKIVARGTHLVSHASGVNRIRGGSVQVN